MKTLLFALMLVSVCLAVYARLPQGLLPTIGYYYTPETLSGLLSNASTTPSAQNYLIGAYDLTQESGQSCAQRGTTSPAQLEQVFSDYLKSHPELTNADRTAASVAAQAFAEHWPCQTSSTSTPSHPEQPAAKGSAIPQQDELEKLIAGESCQNIGSVAAIAISDSQFRAREVQLPEAKGFIASGVTLDEYLRAALVLHCIIRDQKQYKLPQFTWTIQKSPVINAWAYSEQKRIVLTTGIIDFTRDDPGELAFMVAHEIGHFADQPNGCDAALQKAGELTLFPLVNQRTCETRADNIGFQYLVGAGFNPYGAAAFFGRIQMYQGRQGLLDQFLSDHPITTERVQNLRDLYIKLSEDQAVLPTVR